MTDDSKTAAAFANSWNHLPAGSVYTLAQFEDWLAPLTRADVEGRTVLELGCGNGSLLVHLAGWNPGQLEGIDLGAVSYTHLFVACVRSRRTPTASAQFGADVVRVLEAARDSLRHGGRTARIRFA